MKPIIYKPKRYVHLCPIICPYCLMNPSIGKLGSFHGVLGCRFCQGEVDKAIEAQFEVIELDS